ncbi:MAG: type II secretion system protein GspG [Candidatus Omnitrophica bacterium]|nr:type II secretion system protein GspG [Candidatus Omnitrophota bacterium]
MSRLRNSQDGFTSLELLVAAIVILLLAVSSVAIVSRVETWAAVAQAKTEIIQISMAVEMEKYDTGFYTLNLPDLRSQTAPSGISPRFWKGPYLKKDFSLNDPWTIPYLICEDAGIDTPLVSARKPYQITSYGANKVQGGTGLDTDIIWHSKYSGFQD